LPFSSGFEECVTEEDDLSHDSGDSDLSWLSPTVFSALVSTLGVQFSLSNSRLLTLAVLISGVAVSRTVNLAHLAAHSPNSALQTSNDRRLQRFF